MNNEAVPKIAPATQGLVKIHKLVKNLSQKSQNIYLLEYVGLSQTKGISSESVF